MELSLSASTSLMATPSISRVSPSLASRSSLFFSNGGGFRSVSARRRRGGGAAAVERRSSGGLNCRCLFGLGVPELVVIAGVAALVFGPRQLPEVGRSIGKTVKSFQQAAKEFETELKKEPDVDPLENPTSVSSEGEKKELEASKESI